MESLQVSTVFYPVIKDPQVQMVNAFLAEGRWPDSFHKRRVVLIAKPGGDPSLPQGYRPIKLLNVDYKIDASLLAKRVGSVLPHIVSLAQIWSVPGRTIFFALTLTRGLVTYATRTGILGIFVSVDEVKAFVRVEPLHLLAVLGCFGFARNCVATSEPLYSNVKSELLVNGQLTSACAIG